jgi:hypothetical protein
MSGINDFSDDFLVHAVNTPSQYDSTCRGMAAEILRLRSQLVMIVPIVTELREARAKQRYSEKRIGVIDREYHARVTLAAVRTQQVERRLADAVLTIVAVPAS